jgi:hypothetical protein
MKHKTVELLNFFRMERTCCVVVTLYEVQGVKEPVSWCVARLIMVYSLISLCLWPSLLQYASYVYRVVLNYIQ